jgi:hypothetical protein
MRPTSTAINATIARHRVTAARPLRYSVLTVICGSVMILGFFFAARQHFSSIEFGIKNSRLRKQLDELEAEKRRLLLAKEISMSPLELMKASRKVGQTASINSSANPQAIRVNAASRTPVTVQKTVLSRPVIVDDNARAEKVDRRAKKEISAKDKKS